jgi:hypothetical protein
MSRPSLLVPSLLIALATGVSVPVHAQDAGAPDSAALKKIFPKGRPYSPYAGRAFPTRPLFGDTHLHTAASMDAGAAGARISIREAYRFARGEELMASSGQPVKLSRPLDFLVVADHSDNMGFFPDFLAGKPEMLADSSGRAWYDLVQAGRGMEAAFQIVTAFSSGTFPKALIYLPGTRAYRGAWEETIAAAEAYNDPGRFTAFIGYEWTSQAGGNNVHRNVVFRDGGDKARQVEPFTAMPPLGSENPADLWKWMDGYQQKTGGSLLAIAHNGNLSNGVMFPIVEAFGKPVDRDYAATRARLEPLYEVTQMKGDGEAHPFLSPNDEFADFERWDKANLTLGAAKRPEMLEFEYARSGLQHGLKLEQKLGVNPFKFGMIGSTDSHTGLATAEEENFFGKVSAGEPSPERMGATFMNQPKIGVKIMDWEVSASGYAAAWATENTREAIWDAMSRRETYATTGTRMMVRFFGGWDFVPSDAHDRMPAVVGYTKGVPMGGDLRKAPAGKAPTFLVAALKDPIGANLDRIQVIKGWLDASGALHEKIYDVAWSDGRKPDPRTGKLPSVGTTVDVANATWTNTIGDSELITVWKDPDFDPSQRAVYYVRVIEIPTPRWTAYDAKRLGSKPLPGTKMTVTERAYTSPIWYTPN